MMIFLSFFSFLRCTFLFAQRFFYFLKPIDDVYFFFISRLKRQEGFVFPLHHHSEFFFCFARVVVVCIARVHSTGYNNSLPRESLASLKTTRGYIYSSLFSLIYFFCPTSLVIQLMSASNGFLIRLTALQHSIIGGGGRDC